MPSPDNHIEGLEEVVEERCESCDNTGIYWEGSEWAPCGECELGRGFLKRLLTYAEEVRKQAQEEERERLRDMTSDHADPEWNRAIHAAADTLEALAILDQEDPDA